MSVNEVKLTHAAEPLVVLGSGPPTSRTFCLGDEDHTLGNALRHVLIQDKNVNFAGYSVPHPSEPVVQIRVQAKDDATERLQTACHTLSEQCNIVLKKLEELLPEVQEDRLRMEKIVLEDALEEDQEDDDDDMDEA